MSRNWTKPKQLAHYSDFKTRAVLREMKALDRHSLKFLELSPTCSFASTDAHGIPDVSPRGGEPGFVRAVEEHTIVLPDRSGNNRLDSLRNVLVNPGISLLFMIPGVNETLRIKGQPRLLLTR